METEVRETICCLAAEHEEIMALVAAVSEAANVRGEGGNDGRRIDGWEFAEKGSAEDMMK
jgi:hypothetical protein